MLGKGKKINFGGVLMENTNETRKSREIFTTIGEFVKDNAGKLIGAAALGGGIAADVVRVKRHKAKISNDSGEIVEKEIETLDENGNEIPEETTD